MKRGLIWTLIIAILVVLATAIYFTFFFYYTCEDNDLACYREHQKECAKTIFVNDKEDVTWQYRILGNSDGKCEVEATVLQIKQGDLTKISLEGKSMICSLESGSVISPEEDLKNCHGLLKEDIQEIMIQNAHAYIISNIGKVGEELEKGI